MADYAERVLRLPESMRGMYFAAMEATDNGVLYDHYQKQKADTEAMEKEAATRRKRPRARTARK